AGAWVNTAVNAGSASGTAGVGLLVGHLPLGLCFAIAGAVAVAVGVLSAQGARAARASHGASRDTPELTRAP
ncbi:MFS transporter, partial [Streptomyces mirabilis]